MPYKYRCWSKNPFVARNNGTPYWRIFENFPDDVKVWYNIVVDVGHKKFFFFLRTVSQIEVIFNRFQSASILLSKNVPISSLANFRYVATSYNCLLHSLIMSYLSVFAGPRFLSVSLMTWIRFFSVHISAPTGTG